MHVSDFTFPQNHEVHSVCVHAVQRASCAIIFYINVSDKPFINTEKSCFKPLSSFRIPSVLRIKMVQVSLQFLCFIREHQTVYFSKFMYTYTPLYIKTSNWYAVWPVFLCFYFRLKFFVMHDLLFVLPDRRSAFDSAFGRIIFGLKYVGIKKQHMNPVCRNNKKKHNLCGGGGYHERDAVGALEVVL